MFDFIKKGVEFNKLAQSFGAIYTSVNELNNRLVNSQNNLALVKAEFRQEILILACVACKGITERLDNNHWDFDAKIMVPSISNNRITVGYAWSQTITRLLQIVDCLDLGKEFEEINNNGNLFQLTEPQIPNRLKNW